MQRYTIHNTIPYLNLVSLLFGILANTSDDNEITQSSSQDTDAIEVLISLVYKYFH